MKFLRDLKLISDAWYKRYLSSQRNETDPRLSEISEEEQEYEEQNQFKFRSPIDEELDFDALNTLFDNQDSQFDSSEQEKQLMLFSEKLRKQKAQLILSKSKTSIDENDLEISIHIDDLDQQHGIEQFFPEASILGPQYLVPSISEAYYDQVQQNDTELQMNPESIVVTETDVQDQSYLLSSPQMTQDTENIEFGKLFPFLLVNSSFSSLLLFSSS